MSLLCVVAIIAPQARSRAACAGRDLFVAMRTEAPDAVARIEAEAKDDPFANGLLFKIEGGAKPSFLFGTLHVADPRVAKLSPRVRDALAATNTLMLETIDPSTFSTNAESGENRSDLKKALVATPEQRSDALLSRDEFARLARVAQGSGLPNATLATLKPEVIAILLGTPKCDLGSGPAKPFIDLLLAKAAKDEGIQIIGLETLSQQLEALDGLPAAAERQLLLSTIVQAEHSEDIVETSIQRYLEGRTGVLVAWMRSDSVVPGEAVSQTPKVFLDRLLSFRNKRMVRQTLPYLRKGGSFLAVGAAHLPGKDGLAMLLTQEGFTVTKIR